MSDIYQDERDNIHAMLLSSVSHDLKTPLSCIIGSLEIYQQLNESLSPVRKKDLINTALQEAKRLDSFITNILDMAKLESNVTFKFEPVDMIALIKQSVAKMEIAFSNHILKLILPNIFIATVSELWINRALTALLDNAALYAPKNSDIVVSISRNTPDFSISVRDYGVSIDKEIKKSLFNKSNRAIQQDRKIAGTGLGLPICGIIASRHGGSIKLETPDDGGNIFIMTLPLVQIKK
jgi:two-component system, OmpR family, sensor histidine kinase KdpD